MMLHERVGRVTQHLEEGHYRDSLHAFEQPVPKKNRKKSLRIRAWVLLVMMVLYCVRSMGCHMCTAFARRSLRVHGGECTTPAEAALFLGMPQFAVTRFPVVVVFENATAWRPREVSRDGVVRSTEHSAACGGEPTVRLRAATVVFDAYGPWGWIGGRTRRTVRGALGSCIQRSIDYFNGKEFIC